MRFGIFPSFSAGWKFSEEDFIKNLNIFSFGKLRVGYGSVGNSAINPYSYYANVASLGSANYDFGGTNSPSSGAEVANLANPSVHWEAVVTEDVGLDLSFLKNRLSLNLDYFQKYNNGMLMQNPIKGYDGYAVRDVTNENGSIDPTPYVNVGKLKNTGLEITAGWKDEAGDFKYAFDGNVTFISSKAVSLSYDSVFNSNSSSKGINGYISYTRVGEPVGEFYGYKVDRVFTAADVDTTGNPKGFVTNQPYTVSATGTKVYAQAVKPGDFKFKDINGDGKINYQDIVPLGNPMPNFLYSLNMNFEYKFLDLQLFWQGTYGNKIFNTTKFYQANSDGSFNWSSAYVNDHYRGPITNLNGTVLYPANYGGTMPGLTQTASISTISDFYVEDGSYLRLKNVQLGLTLPKNWLNWMNISTFRIYVGGRNLLTFTKYTGIDPEVDVSTPTAAGIDKGAYPQAKVYTVGINIKF